MGARVNVAVCIPFRPVDEEREANLTRTRQQWDDLGWPVYLGDHEGDSFCRGLAINAAAEQAGDAEVLIVSDCDFLLEKQVQARQAVESAVQHDAYVVAYSHMLVLDQEGTNIVRNGGHPRQQNVIETVALIWGNCFAIPTELFWRVCGFDYRFRGWGAEDIGFLVSASTMGGPKQRIPGVAFHLTHPTNEDRDHLPENNALASHYRSADGDREAMAVILKERGCE